nr:hypothetical protein [Pandoravirus belohorizontensis]
MEPPGKGDAANGQQSKDGSDNKRQNSTQWERDRDENDTADIQPTDAETAGMDRWRQHLECVAGNPWYATQALRSNRNDGDAGEWIADATAMLRAICAVRPTAPCHEGDAVKRQENTEKQFRHLLSTLDIPPGRDGVRGCALAVANLTALWEALAADSDAVDAARAYLTDWPPSRSTVASLLVDITRGCCGHRSVARYIEIASNASLSPRVLIETLGDAARSAARMRATHETERFRDPMACDDGAQYLLLFTEGDRTYDTATLVCIARGNAADGVGTLLGRIHRQQIEADSSDLPAALPAPSVGSLPLRLRPYVGFIPALLVVVAVKCAAANPDGRVSGRRGNGFWREHVDDKDLFPRCPPAWRTAPMTSVCSPMRPIDSPARIPPRVICAHVRTPRGLAGAQYAWLSECELERALAVIAGQHVASLFCLAHARYGQLARTDANNDSDSVFVGDDNQDVQHAPPLPRAFSPRSLAAQAHDAILRTGARVALQSLPAEVADPLAFDMWHHECLMAGRAADDDGHHHAHDTGAYRLFDVARHWGVEPTAAHVDTPRVLCGALAGQAVARAMRGGDRLDPASVARIGPPLLTTTEHDALSQVCTVPKNRRFLWTPDVVDLVRQIVWDDAWLGEPVGYEAFDEGVVDRASAVVAGANQRYNVKPDAGTPGVDREAAATGAIETRVQILLAVAALRSGIALYADDLADAGSARALLAPLDALFP